MMECGAVQLKYGALGYVDKNAGVSDLLAYLYGPSNTSPTGVRNLGTACICVSQVKVCCLGIAAVYNLAVSCTLLGGRNLKFVCCVLHRL